MQWRAFPGIAHLESCSLCLYGVHYSFLQIKWLMARSSWVLGDNGIKELATAAHIPAQTSNMKVHLTGQDLLTYQDIDYTFGEKATI